MMASWHLGKKEEKIEDILTFETNSMRNKKARKGAKYLSKKSV